MRKLQKNDAKNKEKIKFMKKLHKNIIKSLNKLNSKKIETFKDNTVTLISSLSGVLKKERNCKTICVELCEKKIEENKKEMECDIVKLKHDHNTEIVLLKNQLKCMKRNKIRWSGSSDDRQRIRS